MFLWFYVKKYILVHKILPFPIHKQGLAQRCSQVILVHRDVSFNQVLSTPVSTPPANLSKTDLKFVNLCPFPVRKLSQKKLSFIIRAAKRKVMKSPPWPPALPGKAAFRIAWVVCWTHSNAVAPNKSLALGFMLFFGFILSSTSCTAALGVAHGSPMQHSTQTLTAGHDSWCLSTLLQGHPRKKIRSRLESLGLFHSWNLSVWDFPKAAYVGGRLSLRCKSSTVLPHVRPAKGYSSLYLEITLSLVVFVLNPLFHSHCVFFAQFP